MLCCSRIKNSIFKLSGNMMVAPIFVFESETSNFGCLLIFYFLEPCKVSATLILDIFGGEKLVDEVTCIFRCIPLLATLHCFCVSEEVRKKSISNYKKKLKVERKEFRRGIEPGSSG